MAQPTRQRHDKLVPLEIQPLRSVPLGPGGEVARVVSGSPAALAGVRCGDWLVAVNGLVVRDLIDYSYETLASRLELALERHGKLVRIMISKEPDQELGLEFRLPVFEGIRECNNNCEFCFIRGLPHGLRRPLYIRDDDYRYSFLFGNFLTLTNLDEADWHRIACQRLSPLCVSIHATDLEVRRQMLRNPHAPDILGQLDRLGELNIEIKAQIVLCPGQNDGEILERSVRELGARTHVVDSVAIVPVGLTRYSSKALAAVTCTQARAVVQQARVWQRDFRKRHGRDFVYLSDELYQLAGEPLPAAKRYDGFRQVENGVGLTRLMLREWAPNRRRIPDSVEPARRVVWLCGRAAATALRQMASDLMTTSGLDLDVLEVPNDFFGGSISVSGLLAGRDLVSTLAGVKADLAVLPRSAFGFEGRETLDGWTPAAIAQQAPLRIAVGKTPRELLDITLQG